MTWNAMENEALPGNDSVAHGSPAFFATGLSLLTVPPLLRSSFLNSDVVVHCTTRAWPRPS